MADKQNRSIADTKLLHHPVFYILLFVILAFTHLWPQSVNDQSRMALVESLLEREVFWIEDSRFKNYSDAVLLQGHLYSDKQPLLSVYSAALLYPVHPWITFRTKTGRFTLYYLATLMSSGLALVVLFYFLRRGFKLLDMDDKRALWTTAWILFGSCILPFGVTYNTHVIESTLFFTSFYYLLEYRIRNNPRSPWICGLLLGISSAVHLVAASVFILMTGLYFLASRLMDSIKFMVLVALVLGMAAALNFAEHGNIKFSYLTPEAYVHKASIQTYMPERIPGLTEEKIVRRFEELNLPQDLRIQFLDRFRQFRKQSSSLFIRAKKQWDNHDSLTFTPALLIGVFSALTSLLKKSFPLKREALWVLAGSVTLYAGLFYLKSIPGGSFGNRYLVPIIPVATFFAAFYFEREDNFIFFKLIFWIVCASMLAGIIFPWTTPNERFIKVNFFTSFGLLSLHFLSKRWQGIPVALRAAHDFLNRKKWLMFALIVLIFMLEFYLYRPSASPGLLNLPLIRVLYGFSSFLAPLKG